MYTHSLSYLELYVLMEKHLYELALTILSDYYEESAKGRATGEGLPTRRENLMSSGILLKGE